MSTSSQRSTIQTEIWSDLACPWCYVGCKRLNKAIEALGDKAKVDVEWHAFLLDPNYHQTHPEGEPLDPFYEAKFGKARGDAIKQRLIESGAPDGARFERWLWRANTLPGHRLVALARSHGKSHAAKEALFRKIYEEGENISNPDVLIEVGKQLELPDVEGWVNSDEGVLDVLKDDDVGKHQLGVTGVPTFLVRSGNSKTYMFSGAQPVEVFLSAFDKVLEEGNARGGQGAEL